MKIYSFQMDYDEVVVHKINIFNGSSRTVMNERRHFYYIDLGHHKTIVSFSSIKILFHNRRITTFHLNIFNLANSLLIILHDVVAALFIKYDRRIQKNK